MADDKFSPEDPRVAGTTVTVPTTSAAGWLRSRAARPYRLAGFGLAALAVLWMATALLLPPEYDGFAAREQELYQTVVATGRVRADSRVRLGAQITGVVSRVTVREGDSVKTGQVLLQIDDVELRAAAAQAKAALAQAAAALESVARVRSVVTAASRRQAESALRKAEADFARVTSLRTAGTVSDDEFERVQQTLASAQSAFDIADAQAAAVQPDGADRRSAEAAVATARASFDAAAARVAHAAIAARSAGIVLTRSVEPGDLVQPGRVLMELAVRATAQLVVVPDERNLASLTVGQRAVASADAFPGRRFPARVTYVSPSVDATQGTVEVRLTIDSAPPYLRPDMTVSVEIEVARSPKALVIPLDAVREPLSLRPWVFVRRHGRAERQELRIGTRGELFVEVLDGVKAGETVLRPGLRKVEAGDRVRVRVASER